MRRHLARFTAFRSGGVQAGKYTHKIVHWVEDSMSRLTRHSRRGIECLEAAITLPIFITVVLATVNICHCWHVEKLLRIASYEAVKAACRPDGTEEDAKSVFATQAKSLGIQGAVLEMKASPKFKPGATGEWIDVCGTAPLSENKILSPVQVYFGNTLSGGWITHRKVEK